ncbi:MAG: glycosyltransferase, partial [Planctomycetes bacterium]|nr:glycosyltransferase [Planctomycetota bacterium]
MLASALVGRGHRVLWWTSTFDHYAKRHVAKAGETREIESGITIRFLPAFAYARNLSVRRYVSHIRTARAFRRAAEREPIPDLIVASMPDYFLAAEAVSYGRARGVPIVVDVRDQWPDVFLSVLPQWSRLLAAAALAPDRSKLRRLLRDADATTSVIDSVLSWALERAGRERRAWDRVFYLGSEA